MITTRIVGQELFLVDTNTNKQYPLLILQPGTTGDDLNWAEGLCHFIEEWIVRECSGYEINLDWTNAPEAPPTPEPEPSLY